MTRNSLRFPVAVVSATLLLGALGPMRASGTTLDDKKAQADQLQREGAQSFDKSWNELLDCIAIKSDSLKKVAQA